MVPAVGEWSARGDSNPDLHGLGVPRLPIAPRADDELVPSDGLEPPPHGLRTRRAAFTLRRELGRLERMAGLEPAPQGLEGPQATVTPHSPWFGRWYQSLIPDRTRTGGVHRPRNSCQLSKTPLLRAGDSARIRTRTHEVWMLRDRTSPRPDAGFLPRVGTKQKRPSRGSPWKACF